jgi:hypothetical protein
MIRGLTLHGPTGSIAWASRPIALVTGWHVRRKVDADKKTATWRLEARLVPPVDHYQLRQRPLLFVAPRRGGFWCFPVKAIAVIADALLTADLDPPEY